MTLAILTLLLISHGAPPPTAHQPAPGPEWELRDDNGAGTLIWQRPFRGSDVDEIKIESVLHCSAPAAWAVLRDVAHYPDWMPYMEEARIIRELGNERIVYQRLSPPFADDRDYTLRAVATIAAGGTRFRQTISIANDRGPGLREDTVRVSVLEGGWTLDSIDAETTRITYQLHTEPGGNVPDFAVNFGQRRSLPKLLRAIENRSKSRTEDMP